MNHLGTVELSTPRLLLRRCRMEDAAAMFRNYTGDPEVTRYLTWKPHESLEDTRTILGAWTAEYEDPRFYLWLIVLKENNEPIGTISVVGRNDLKQSVEIGYCIGRPWWGRGLVTEALRALLAFFFEEVGVLRVEAKHDPNNPASGCVMEKAGLRYEKTTRRSVTNNQGLCDAAHYALSRAEYLEATQVCGWALASEIERRYHDTQWGIPVQDDALLFEMLVLEYMQAGLSWRIILEKREAMREAFDGFHPAAAAEYTPEDVGRLMQNASIVRNRRKLEALPVNARAFLRVQKEFGSFRRYLWGFTGEKTILGNWETLEQVPVKTPLSEAISKDMKKRGFVFVGPVIVYSYLQAVGIVNDHLRRCPAQKKGGA